MLTFNYDSLFDKSRHFIGKCIAARNAGKLEDCQLWAAIALEILAKAALAKIHPVLVADPRNDVSLLVACGCRLASDYQELRTINANQIYSRIQKLESKLDVDFCMQMANRRNAQLHSGETPYAAMKLNAWIPQYWKACKVLLELQKKSLSDWINDDEATMVEAVIYKRLTALQHSVHARIKSSRQNFKDRYPEGSIQREALAQQEGQKQPEPIQPITNIKGFPPPFPHEVVVPSEITTSERCPACAFQGMLTCRQTHEGPVTVEPEQTMVCMLFPPLEFKCEICGLRLKGHEELEVADVGSQGIQVAVALPHT